MTEKTLQVGYIGKAHGIKGEVMVSLTTNRTERVAPDVVLFCGGKPYRIASSSPHQGKWIVRFDGITTRNMAESLRGQILTAVSMRDDDDEFWVDEMVGLFVQDQNGNVLGAVTALEANPASDLLVLESGALIPLKFVLDGDDHYRKLGIIKVAIPDGLLEEGR